VGEPSLAGRRLLIVGASSGVGRAVARRAVDLGAEVVVSARRADKLAELVAELGRGHVVAADVTAPGGPERIVSAAVEAVGDLDVVLYTVGIAHPAPLTEQGREDWDRVLAANVVAPNLLTVQAVPHLTPAGICAYVSSQAVDVDYWAMGPYSASKVALDRSIELWRHEQPERRFLRITLGNTAPTDFADGWDPRLLTIAAERWSADGIRLDLLMDAADVAGHVVDVLASMLAHPALDSRDLRLNGRPPPD
jgi:NAD(P)-dependent dehydrogenase (short-subunit alcohol dehydrogenase family)